MNPTINPLPVRLLADGMLGRLARWLRILGYDTVYASDTDDTELLRMARAQDRILLTADHELARRRGARILLIEAPDLQGQLRQVRTALGPPPDDELSRCLVCNGRLVQVDKSVLADRLPPHILTTQKEFRRCPDCGRIFWSGTHVEKMRALLNEQSRKSSQLTLVADVVQSRAICNQGATRHLKKKAIDLARRLVDTIEGKKGEDILLMDIHAQCSFADYFVLCSGSSERQLAAILDAIQETAKKEYGVSPHHVEGKPETGWVLMDLGDVIVHMFSPSQRHFYSLESLWKESPILLRIK